MTPKEQKLLDLARAYQKAHVEHVTFIRESKESSRQKRWTEKDHRAYYTQELRLADASNAALDNLIRAAEGL